MGTALHTPHYVKSCHLERHEVEACRHSVGGGCKRDAGSRKQEGGGVIVQRALACGATDSSYTVSLPLLYRQSAAARSLCNLLAKPSDATTPSALLPDIVCSSGGCVARLSSTAQVCGCGTCAVHRVLDSVHLRRSLKVRGRSGDASAGTTAMPKLAAHRTLPPNWRHGSAAATPCSAKSAGRQPREDLCRECPRSGEQCKHGAGQGEVARWQTAGRHVAGQSAVV